MIEFTLLNVLILELKIYCDPEKFYGRSKLGQYDEVKHRAPYNCFMIKDRQLAIRLLSRQGCHRALEIVTERVMWSLW